MYPSMGHYRSDSLESLHVIRLVCAGCQSILQVTKFGEFTCNKAGLHRMSKHAPGDEVTHEGERCLAQVVSSREMRRMAGEKVG